MLLFWLVAKWLGTGVLGLLVLTLCVYGSAWLLDRVLGPLKKRAPYKPDPWLDHPRS